jgi:hypothetical protein
MPRDRYTQTETWDPDRWARDYSTRTHLETVARKLESHLKQTQDRGASNEAVLENLERRITRLLDQEGVSRELMPFYHGYALERAFRAREKELAVDRLNEARIIRMKWESRGLDNRILDLLDNLIPVS